MRDEEVRMSTIGGVRFAASPAAATSTSGPLSVATALASLRLNPGSTAVISDSRANIESNLDALQRVAARVTSLTTTDSTTQLSVTAAEYGKNAAILAKWGATSGNTVDVTGVAAADAAALASTGPSWVSTFTVTDSSGSLATHLDSLQSLVAAGRLRQIVRTGAAAPLKITVAQLDADAGALAAIKNGAYTLAVTDASVGDALGLDGKSALTANAKVSAVHIKDTTAAIEQNLDALQRVGLKLKTIAQTDTATLTVSASQVKNDAIAIGKILTPYHLDVIRATADQVAKLAANSKVLSVSVSDTAANIAKRWGLLDRLAGSLTAVEVTDSSNPLALTGSQLQAGEDLLAKFSVDAEHTYKLAVTGLRAGQAATIASDDHVASVSVADTADNLAANLAALGTLDDKGLLGGVSVQGKTLNLALDAAQLIGDAAAATKRILGKITNLNYGVAVTGASVDTLDELAADKHVVSIALTASSDQIASRLDTFAQLGRRLSRIRQTDSGVAIAVTQTEFDRRAGVLAKIEGGYSVDVTGATAEQAIADAANQRVASITVADTSSNLALRWRALRTMGSVLTTVTATDTGPITVLASGYQLARNDGLLAKFAADQHYAATNATVDQAVELAGDTAIDRIGLLEDGSVVAARMTELTDLATGGKLHDITLNAGATRIALGASQLEGAQTVLGLVNGGRYTLALDQVAVGDLADLLAGNSKIASVQVTADAAGIVAHLGVLGAAGHKLTAISRTDDAEVALELSAADFDDYRAELDKIGGGYLADLTQASASRAAGLAGDARVKSLTVSDTGANLSTHWNALSAIGTKLTGIAQSDSALIGLGAAQWARTLSLGEKFSTTLSVSVADATLADLETLDSNAAVKAIQVGGNAAAISAAWSTLAADTKLTGLTVFDPTTALTLPAATYTASTALRGLIAGGQYTATLSDAAIADAATLEADAHVASFDSSGSSSDIAAAFDTLAGLTKLQSLALTDENGTLSLSAAQVLGGTGTLARIGNGYRIAATAATLANLPGLQAVDNLASIAISDTAAQVAAGLDDLVALGNGVASIHLSDTSPVLALTHAGWSAGATTLAKIDGSYRVDLSEVDAASVSTLAALSDVRRLSVAGTAESIAQEWNALVTAYDGGSGKLVAISLADPSPLNLTTAQQSDGAAMITALLPNATIATLS